MKKIYILSIIFTTTLSISCKKKDPLDIAIGTIKTKIGGNEQTFSVQARATRLNVSGGYGIQVQGYYRTGSTTNLIFTVVSPNLITNNTYTENAGGNPLVTMTHCVEVLFPCVLQTNSFGSLSNPVSISITEITGTYVKGTFKGELKSQAAGGGTPPPSEVFTNGVFYVSF